MTLKTGELARRAGVSVETIRFYERRRLLPAPPRSPSGYREYPEEAAGRIRFIRRAQELGFSLKDCRELMRLQLVRRRDRSDVRAFAVAKVGEIQEKVRRLQAMGRELSSLIRRCDCRPGDPSCSILDCLNDAKPRDDKGFAVNPKPRKGVMRKWR